MPVALGAPPSLAHRLREDRPVLLDGATGTELERRGIPSPLPLWSAHALLTAPEEVRAVHRAYVSAGAEVLCANTFRTQRRTLSTAGLGDRAGALTRLAVDLAREAAGDAPRPVFVVGSAPPLLDCYRPDLTPPDRELLPEHAEHARNLATAGVDAILAETHHTIREACAALRGAAEAGVPAMASFVCRDGAELLSGEPLAAALRAVAPFEPIAVMVNCLPPEHVPPCLPVLAAAGRPFGVYANLGEPDPVQGFARAALRGRASPAGYAAEAVRWLRAGARLVGGCCGTGPDHIRALRELLGHGKAPPGP